MEHEIFISSNEPRTSHHLSFENIHLAGFGLISPRELCHWEHTCIYVRFFTIMCLMFRTNVFHMNFWMCILDLTSILLKLLYHVSRTLIPLEEENVGNNYPIFWKTPHKHLYLLSDLHAKGVWEWPSFEMVTI